MRCLNECFLNEFCTRDERRLLKRLPARQERTGFTLVEILVVISIIGILVSLTLSAIGPAQARARQAQCAHRLQQLATATNQYESVRGAMPGYCQSFGEFSGGMDPSDPGNFGGSVPRHMKIGTWQVSILAFLDNQPIYEHWTQDRYPLLADGRGERSATTEGYSMIAAANLETFQCPAASNATGINGKNQYVANTGMHCDTFPFTYLRPGQSQRTVTLEDSMSRSNGIFTNRYAGYLASSRTLLAPIGKKFTSGDFKDGRTGTLMLSENQQAQPWYLNRLTGNTQHLTTIQTIGGRDVATYPPESRYLQGAVWHFEDDAMFAGAPRVQPRHKINGGDIYTEQMNAANRADLARPSSLHIGGVNAAFADGSVRFIAEATDYRVYQAMLTPRGISSDVPMNEFVVTNPL